MVYIDSLIKLNYHVLFRTQIFTELLFQKQCPNNIKLDESILKIFKDSKIGCHTNVGCNSYSTWNFYKHDTKLC